MFLFAIDGVHNMDLEQFAHYLELLAEHKEDEALAYLKECGVEE